MLKCHGLSQADLRGQQQPGLHQAGVGLPRRGASSPSLHHEAPARARAHALPLTQPPATPRATPFHNARQRRVRRPPRYVPLAMSVSPAASANVDGVCRHLGRGVSHADAALMRNDRPTHTDGFVHSLDDQDSRRRRLR